MPAGCFHTQFKEIPVNTILLTKLFVSALLSDLTIISSKFLIPYRGFGILAVIGPVNLDYQRVVSQVNVINRVLTMKLTDFYRYLSSNHYEVH